MNKQRKREPRFTSVLTVHAPDANALIDMLRYDRCCPFLPTDADKITRLAERRGDEADRIVQLLRLASTREPPSRGRWRSFGCSLLDERAPSTQQLTTAELTELAIRPTELGPIDPMTQRQPRFASAVSVRVESIGGLLAAMQDGCCCPAQEVESGKIERLMGGRVEPPDRLIRLARFAGSDDPPDVDAWHARGVDVLDERPLDVAWLTDGELAHLASLRSHVRSEPGS